MKKIKPCHVCNERPKAPGKGRRTCDPCQGICRRCHGSLDSNGRCKDCIKKRNAERYRSEPGYAEMKRIANKLSLYGITREEYDSLDWKCYACARTDDLAIDHDHETGKVRGVLCRKCNAALGLLQESPAAMCRLIQYLEETK